jgi:two-component system sensor histidine kinase PilS (NtrC family)
MALSKTDRTQPFDQEFRPDPVESRLPVNIYFIYRALFALILAILFLARTENSILGRHNPEFFSLVIFIFLGMITASGVILFTSTDRPVKNQIFMMVFVDIVAITLLMHASGGIETGIGMLMVVSIASGSLIIQGSPAILLAALASLAVLTEQIFFKLYESGTTDYTQSGFLGIGFFAIATLSHVFSKRLRQSQALASQREIDLANLEELNSYIIQHMQMGILVVDDEERIRMMNDAAWYLLGMPDARAGVALERASYELTEQLKSWQADRHLRRENFTNKPGGRLLSANMAGLGNAGVVIFIEDAASLTQQAQQMKLASLGRLTASIAHEIRNPLGAISHAEQLLRESPDLPKADQRLIDIINTNSKRVNEVIESILHLTRRDRSQPEEIELKPWLEKFADDFTRTQNLPNSQLTLQVEPDSTRVMSDKTQLRQILTNLCENAVRHFDREPSELKLQIHGGIARDAGGAFLDIIDNGPGISAEAARQMYEPFFTTLNSGTGLGLYITKELCETNRLTIDYLGVPTGGSRFRLTFPSGG